MKVLKKISVLGVLLSMFVSAETARALDVTTDVTTDTTWTLADSPVFLKGPIFVRNGASLTVEAGVTVITLSADDGGLVVTRDSQIFVLGTMASPVIMTSGADVATWAGSVFTGPAAEPTAITTVGDRTTGTWRASSSEWRNLTILGNGVISASSFGGNPVGPSTTGATNNPTVVDGTAQKRMEGLDPSDPGSGDVDDIRYGGADDNDDSGTIQFLSLRYTGRVLGTGDELNGMSMGGIGQATDVSYVDIMNNVDDGIEIWGGKVNFKYVNIWNIGDDSFDIDQGWRGKAQFGLIVQGYAGGTSQGSGIGDNIFEHDGGEQSNVQPTTSGVIYNFTVIGEPDHGDGATTWRDNARMQYRKVLFIDFGEELVRFDNVDGDGGVGYTNDAGVLGVAATDFTALWSTAFNDFPSYNSGTGLFAPDASFYSSQVDGTLAEISDSVVFQSKAGNAWPANPDGDDLASVVGAFPAFGSSGGPLNNVNATVSPVVSFTRGAPEFAGTFTIERVVSLDPRAANDALVAANAAPVNDGFWTPAPYRGAFSATNNWALGWTAADAFGFMSSPANPSDPATSAIELAIEVNFPTDSGVLYVVEKSADGVVFEPVGVILGDGGTLSVADFADFDSSAIYNVRPL